MVLGKTAAEAFPGAWGEELYRFHLLALQSPEPVGHEFTLLLNGVERQIRTLLNPVLDSQGSVIQLVGTPSDVTSEHAIQRAEKNAAAINKEMEDFISLAAHDLRSPMRKVNALAEMLREDLPELSKDNSELLDMLEAVASRSFEMITDLINHAQAADVATESAALENFSLRSVCEQVMTTLDPESSHAWCVVDTQLHCERVAVQIVIRNLIDNAIKHHDHSGETQGVNKLELVDFCRAVRRGVYRSRCARQRQGLL